MRQAMLVLQPQGQLSRVAMRFTAGLSSCSADCAKSPPANKLRMKKLFLNRRMFLCYSNYLRARVRQTNFIRDQTHARTERQHPKSEPNPRDQRENVSLNDGALVVGRETGEVDVEILVQPSTNGHFRSRLLAGLV